MGCLNVQDNLEEMQPDQDKLARARDKQLLRRQSATTRGTPSASPRITPCHFHTNPSGGSPESKENLQLGCILYLNRSGSEMAQISKQRFSPCSTFEQQRKKHHSIQWLHCHFTEIFLPLESSNKISELHIKHQATPFQVNKWNIRGWPKMSFTKDISA